MRLWPQWLYLCSMKTEKMMKCMVGTGAVLVGLYADEGTLIDAVADAAGTGSRTGVIIGVEHREREVIIVGAAPTPNLLF